MNKPISRILFHKNLCPLRGVPQFLKNHEVLVNGMRILKKDHEVFENDELTIDGSLIEIEKDVVYIMDKPKGYVCSRVSDRRPTVYSLLPPSLSTLKALHTVGRLDADTTGLLIFTTNGSLSAYLTDPKNKKEKEYIVTLSQKVDSEMQKEYTEKCHEGIEIPPEKKDGSFIAFPKSLVFSSETTCTIVLTQGRFHEVRRIFKALGNEVIELRRIRLGDYVLD